MRRSLPSTQIRTPLGILTIGWPIPAASRVGSRSDKKPRCPTQSRKPLPSTLPSRVAAKECSPRRKPGVPKRKYAQSPFRGERIASPISHFRVTLIPSHSCGFSRIPDVVSTQLQLGVQAPQYFPSAGLQPASPIHAAPPNLESLSLPRPSPAAPAAKESSHGRKPVETRDSGTQAL